jgi:DNA (cytosine-5)-methyltransferase 1
MSNEEQKGNDIKPILAPVRVLNLYAGIGGNRKHWENVEVTAIEYNEEIANVYKQLHPNDNVIVTDAHDYLAKHWREFDFIWSSPPCPSHSRAAFGARKSESSNHKPVFPDLKLYEEIIFLKHYFNGKYVVENVIPFYTPLIPAQKRGRHLYWTNFILPNDLGERKSISMESKNEVDQWCMFHDYDFRQYKGEQRVDKIARNLVDYEAGLTIFNIAKGIEKQNNINQTNLF